MKMMSENISRASDIEGRRIGIGDFIFRSQKKQTPLAIGIFRFFLFTRVYKQNLIYWRLMGIFSLSLSHPQEGGFRSQQELRE